MLAATSIASLIVASRWPSSSRDRYALSFEVAHPMFQLDPFSALVTAVIGFAALLSCAVDPLSRRAAHQSRRFYALILFATSGMMLLVAAVDMLPVFLGSS